MHVYANWWQLPQSPAERGGTVPTHCWQCRGDRWLTAGRSWWSGRSCLWPEKAADPGPRVEKTRGCLSWWRTSVRVWSASGERTGSGAERYNVLSECLTEWMWMWVFSLHEWPGIVCTSGKFCILQYLTPFRNLKKKRGEEIITGLFAVFNYP